MGAEPDTGTPARTPDAEGHRRARRRAHLLRGLRRAASRRSCCCRPGRSSTRALWKCQIPYLARHCRVVTFDGRGNGLSDRPADPRAYAEPRVAADAVAVLDATGTERGRRSSGSRCGARCGAACSRPSHPDRVAGCCLIAPAVPLSPHRPERGASSFDDELDTYEGWAKYNRHYWLRDYRGFLEFFFAQIFTEPHSTKQIEDGVGWGLRDDARDARSRHATGDGLATTQDARGAAARACAARSLVVHGHADDLARASAARALAELTGGRLVTLEGSGHAPHARDPVAGQPAAARLRRGARRRRRARGRAAASRPQARARTSRRRSGSATPGATSRSPTSCAGCTRTSRSTGSPSTR